MRIDLSMMIWDPGNRRPYKDLLKDAAEAAQAAEQAGFEGIWLSEHHFQSAGFDVSPNPLMLASYLAHYTTKLRLGVGAVSIPLWNPIRAAEDAAMVDHISDGRLDMGFSRGISPIDIVNLNPAADRSKAEQSFEIFEESVDAFIGAWKSDAFQYKGKHFQYPQPNLKIRPSPWYEDDARRVGPDREVLSLEVLPRPLQDIPPLYNVSESMSGFQFAAKRNMNPITWFPNGSKLDKLLETYQEEMKKHHGLDLRKGEGCALMRPGFAAKTSQKAKSVLSTPAINMAGAMGSDVGGGRGLVAFCDVGENDVLEAGGDAYDFFREKDQLFSGSPAEIIDQLSKYEEKYGISHFVCWLNPYGVGHSDFMETISLYGETIIPQMKKHSY
jgi:alkanesulfonate monooxygenase SsuD/methylene tetrahydromethanopterin reductase-like flavin-dependent oxidoreductase (luciferase family)